MGEVPLVGDYLREGGVARRVKLRERRGHVRHLQKEDTLNI